MSTTLVVESLLWTTLSRRMWRVAGYPDLEFDRCGSKPYF